MSVKVHIRGCVECGQHTDNRSHVCDTCEPLYRDAPPSEEKGKEMTDHKELDALLDDWQRARATMRKQTVDQIAHFSVGYVGVVMLLCFGVPSALAFAFIMAGALGRELSQHRTIYPWDLGKGSFLDLAFWALGAGLAALTVSVA